MPRKVYVLFEKPTARQAGADQDATDSQSRGWGENTHYTARGAAKQGSSYALITLYGCTNGWRR